MVKIISKLFADFTSKINEINKKYEKPKIKMAPLASGALFALRLYLIIMVLVLLYKFITTVASAQ